MLSLIVAMDTQQIIGRKNILPWYLPADLRHFRAITWGKPVIMGRKTYESIGKPLKGRMNVVLSHQVSALPGCLVMHALEEVLQFCQNYHESLVIGGATLYQQFLPYVQRLYITWIHAHFTGDTYFPAYNVEQWYEVDRQDHCADTNNPYAYSFVTYQSNNVFQLLTA